MTRNLAVDRLPRSWAEMAQRMPQHEPDAHERKAIDQLLKLHGISDEDRAWMVPSCPDLLVALEFYPLEALPAGNE